MSNGVSGRARVNHLVGRLCKDLGSRALQLDVTGEVGLSGRLAGRDVGVTLVYREKEDLLALYSPVGTMLAGEPGAMQARVLLATNLSPRETCGMAFAATPLDGAVLLTYSLIVSETSYAVFKKAFLRLFGASAHWQARFREIEVRAEATTTRKS